MPRRPAVSWFLVVLGPLLSGGLARAQGPPGRFDVTRDTWGSSVGREGDASLGGSPKLKLKTYQEMALVDADLAPLRGRVITRAELHVRSTGEPRLARVTVGGVASEWFEGKSGSYAPEDGASTFRRRRHPGEAWTPGGGDLAGVILGNGGTTNWGSAEATAPDAAGWQVVAVDPRVVAARVAGLSFGFVLFDDTGTEWTRDGNRFQVRPMPNRFVASRDSNRASAPYFTVEAGPEDRDPPTAPGGLRVEADPLPAGEAAVAWDTPPDAGPAGTLGFLAEVDGRPVPQAFVPIVRPGSGRNRLHLLDLDLRPGATVRLAVRAVDAAGNVGPAATLDVPISDRTPRPIPPDDRPAVAGGEPARLRWRGATVAAIDELDKLDPMAGAVVPAPAEGGDYLAANHLWDGARRSIRLEAARNEFVGFQVVLLGDPGPVEAALAWEPAGEGPPVAATLHRPVTVSTPRGWMPDPVVPLVDWDGGRLRGGDLYVEAYVPHDARPGPRRGTLTLRAGGDSLALTVELEVLDFALPDTLSFVPEMNCYGLPDAERDYYRLAHRHRAALNRVPYSQRGEVAPGMAPRLVDRKFDWSEWDRRFGPLLDGSAFADLPRAGVPVDAFYLPMHENWPSPIEGNYDGGYWADRAFKPAYRAAFVAASREFAAHLDARGWRSTVFEGFLNNKRDFKAGDRGWAGGSSPWLLDEPASFQDFWALRYFAAAFHEGVAEARRSRGGLGAKLAFRADISRPEWQRDALDGLLDVNVVGGAMRDRLALVRERKRAENQWVFEYGTANAVDASNVQAAAWCVDAWGLGADGVIPWQTIGNAKSWAVGDELALLYPPHPKILGADGGPIPSLRLKAFRRGQQDVEYLALRAKLRGEPRWAAGAEARRALGLRGDRRSRGGDDAGSITYGDLRPADLAALRRRVGRELSDLHPPADRRPPTWAPTPRDPGHGNG